MNEQMNIMLQNELYNVPSDAIWCQTSWSTLPYRWQTPTQTNDEIYALSIRPRGPYLKDILFENQKFSFTKMHVDRFTHALIC